MFFFFKLTLKDLLQDFQFHFGPTLEFVLRIFSMIELYFKWVASEIMKKVHASYDPQKMLSQVLFCSI